MIAKSNKVVNKLVSISLVLTSIIYLYTAGFGVFSVVNQRAIMMMLLLPTIFLSRKDVDEEDIGAKKRILDYFLAILIFVANLYMLFIWEDRAMVLGATNPLDIIMGTIMIIVLLEATRRSCGLFLSIISALFILYALMGPYFPAAIAHRGETWTRVVSFLYLTTEGIFGTAMGVASTYIIVFVIFGAFLEKFGGGEWFIKLAYAVTGRYRGGPAKTAVVASGLMGMISGAPAANVATTGTFTIPLMKKTGYTPEEAGAIEAVASTGGIFTPPIMGAAAFLMAEYLRIPYATVAKSAIIPALLYFFTLMLVVDALAVKKNLLGQSPDDLPKFRDVMKEQGILSIPLIVIIFLIVIGYSPMKAAFYSTLLTILVAFFTPQTRPTVKMILDALKQGSKGCVPIISACATSGIIVGIISMTGLGAKLSYTLIGLSNGNLLLAGLICAVVALILGCGMPPTAVYIILSSILAPSLVDLGANPIAAHLFIFIFAAVGALTPPVAITAYTGAAIADANPNKTGIKAFRYGISAYIIPFMFLISPEIILIGEPLLIMKNVISLTIGIICLAVALEGYFIMIFSKLPRIIMGLSCIGLIIPGTTTDIIGFIGVILAIGLNIVTNKNNNKQLKKKDSIA